MSERLRSVLIGLLTLLVLAALGFWLVNNTEWAEEKIYQPPTGEARENDLYVAQKLARALGAAVERRAALDQLPPAKATLVLTSWNWDVLPESGARLRQWVEQGGHLVLPAYPLDDESMDWLPVRRATQKSSASGNDNKCRISSSGPVVNEDDDAASADADDSEADEDGASGDEAEVETGDTAEVSNDSTASDQDENGIPCRHLSESGINAGPGFRVCGDPDWRGHGLETRPGAATLWAAADQDGVKVLRAAFGQGDVTVSHIRIDNDSILLGDHAQVFAAAIRLTPGMALWFIDDAPRESLLVWLWQRAWIVFVLAALALIAALWRGMPRFGPRQALPRLERRSMAEQIVGTAHFLARHDPQSLHQAALRAFDEAAAPRLPRNYPRLDLNARAVLVAPLTGQTASELSNALSQGRRSPARLEVDLRCLETAARRLRERPSHP
ncbi:MAG: DUF4350 domain-containing protein [Azonexus sp.]|jgi:hypothetical protein|nr:DUF4350 domain-containing protein [Azonexus sp.]